MSSPDAGSRDVDRAALLGAAMAAVVALTFGGEGEWDWMAAAAVLALLAVLAVFSRLSECEALADAAEDEDGSVRGNCLGAAATTWWLPLPAAGTFLLIFVVMDVRTHRVRAAADPTRADSASARPGHPTV